MNKLSIFLTLPVLALLPACASAVSGPMQTVTIETPGSYSSRCILQNGNRYNADNGVPVTIMRSEKDLTVDCYGSDNRHRQVVVESDVNGWTAGNAVTGVLPGVAYDHVSKAMYGYPEIITVDFIGVPGRGYELPQYHDKDMPNPYAESIEPYAPTMARIPSDGSYLQRGMPKQAPVMDSNPFMDSSDTTVGTNSGAMITPLPNGVVNGAGVTTTGLQPVLSGSNAEELTRSMNPTVFAPR